MDPVDAMDHMDGRQDGRCHFTGSAVEPIIAPSYRLYPHETTEQSQVQSALRTYGVQPAADDA